MGSRTVNLEWDRRGREPQPELSMDEAEPSVRNNEANFTNKKNAKDMDSASGSAVLVSER